MQKTNLFILHTQYNLIIACSLIKQIFPKDRNDLILHAEFAVSTSLKRSLEKTFKNILYLQTSYVKKETTLGNELYLFRKYLGFRGFKKIAGQKYNRLLLAQEDRIDTLIVRDLMKVGKANISYIEDGVDAYFSINADLNKLDSNTFRKQHNINLKNRPLAQKVLGTIKKLVYGKNTFFEPKYCYGMNSMYTDAYVLFPNHPRDEIVHSQIKEIPKPSLIKGINSLYNNVPMIKLAANRIVFIFFDLIDRIPSDIDFENFLFKTLEWSKKNQVQIMYKYHPREIGSYPMFENSSNCTAVDKTVPSEKVLSDLEGKQVTVIGNLSTSLIVAKKIGFSAICIINILGIKNARACTFFQNIGIEVPGSFSELMGQLENRSV